MKILLSLLPPLSTEDKCHSGNFRHSTRVEANSEIGQSSSLNLPFGNTSVCNSNNVKNFLMPTEPIVNVIIKEEKEMAQSDSEHVADRSNFIGCTSVSVQNTQCPLNSINNPIVCTGIATDKNIKNENVMAILDFEQTVEESNSSCSSLSLQDVLCNSNSVNSSKVAAEVNESEFNNVISIINVSSCFDDESAASVPIKKENCSNYMSCSQNYEKQLTLSSTEDASHSDSFCKFNDEKDSSTEILNIKEETSNSCDMQIGTSKFLSETKISCKILDASFIIKNQNALEPQDTLSTSTASAGNILSLSNLDISKENEQLGNEKISISLNIKTEDIFSFQNCPPSYIVAASNVPENLNECYIASRIKSENIFSGQMTDRKSAANLEGMFANSIDNTKSSRNIENENNSNKSNETEETIIETSSPLSNSANSVSSDVILNNIFYSGSVENGNISNKSSASMKFGTEIANPLFNLKSLCGRINSSYVGCNADLPLPWATTVQNSCNSDLQLPCVTSVQNAFNSDLQLPCVTPVQNAFNSDLQLPCVTPVQNACNSDLQLKCVKPVQNACDSNLPLPWAAPVQNAYYSSFIKYANNFIANQSEGILLGSVETNGLLLNNESENTLNNPVIILNTSTSNSNNSPTSLNVLLKNIHCSYNTNENSNMINKSNLMNSASINVNDENLQKHINNGCLSSSTDQIPIASMKSQQLMHSKKNQSSTSIIVTDNQSAESSSRKAVKIWEVKDKQKNVLRGVHKNVLQSLIVQPSSKDLSLQEKSLSISEKKSDESTSKHVDKPISATPLQNHISELRDEATVMPGIDKGLSINEKKSDGSNGKHVDKPSSAITVQNHNIWEIRDKNTVMRGIDKNTLKLLLKTPSGTPLSVAQKNLKLKTVVKNVKQDNKISDQKSCDSVENCSKCLLKSLTTYKKIKPAENAVSNEIENDTMNFDENESNKTVLSEGSKSSSERSTKNSKPSRNKRNGNEKHKLKRKLSSFDAEQKASKLLKLIEPLCKYMDGRKCTLCGFESKANDAYLAKRHMIVHLDKKNFKCDLCGKHYISPERLMSHVSQAHSNKSEHTCTVCDEKFSSYSKLRRHREKHSEAKKYMCIVCNRELSNRNSLRAHYRIHTGERPYECSTCSKSFRTRPLLKSHSLRHNFKSFQCEHCEKTYYDKKALMQHMLVHNDYLKCDTCGKRFNTKSNLAQHMVVHSEERPHNCETCGMKFKLPHHLRSHLATHH